MILSNGEFIDYGEVIWDLTEKFGKEEEDCDYFYFFESCQDKGLLDKCEAYEEVISIVLLEWSKQ